MQQFLPLLLASVLILLGCAPGEPSGPTSTNADSKLRPREEFFLAREYPFAGPDRTAYQAAIQEARSGLEDRSEKVFDARWRVEGPGNIGARINTIAVNPEDERIMLAGFSTGGIFKTTDGGKHWRPVFDREITLAIGDITFDPKNTNIVYAGTGDPNISGYPFTGYGLYRSVDLGETWTQIGLEETVIISKVLVHPTNQELLFVSAMGNPFIPTPDKGLYRSENGGQTWQQILFLGDTTGVIDFVVDPENPDIIYAAGWDRLRNNRESIVRGHGARIYKTSDGGISWEMLANGLPLERHSRIGLAMSGTSPNTLFALVVGTPPETSCDHADLNVRGLYKTTDGGESWLEIATHTTGLPCNALGGFGWYFGKIRVNPKDDDDIFILGVDLWRTRNGGTSWEMAAPEWYRYDVHADKHDLVFTKSDSLVLATDGGAYKTDLHDTEAWKDIEDIPTTQFYRVAYNPHKPELVYGGAQDNGTTGGNLAGFNLWPRIWGGDGFQPAFHPEDSSIMYAETQYGTIYASTDGGFDFYGIMSGFDPRLSRSWDMPYVLSIHDPNVLYAGSYRIFKKDDAPFGAWLPISPDLTRGDTLPLGRYPSITTIAESPTDPLRLYAGTRDGKVWTTADGGENWTDITDGLPERYVTDVFASPKEDRRVFVAHSGYRDNDNTPRLHVSEDAGATWFDIAADLPNLAINTVCVLPEYGDSVIFVGTDGGVFGTIDAGSNWERVGEGMPLIPVYDLQYNPLKNTLIAGTFSRGIQTFPLDSVDIGQGPVVATLETELPGIRIFPTIVSNALIIERKEGLQDPMEYTILHMNGRIWASGQLEAGSTTVDIPVSTLQSGAYLIQLSSGKKRYTHQFFRF